MTGKAFRYIVFGASLVLFCLHGGQTVCQSTVAANSPLGQEFYYFNPDSPQSNLARLKQEFDIYLAENNFSYTFQPFTHFVDFHRLSSEKRPSFILVPEWYFRKYGKALGLKPLLVPVRGGSASYEKVLLAARDLATAITDYEIISFAMTSMGPDSETVVIQKLVAEELVSYRQLNIINVPKDLDAILALALGQVNMALVSLDNLQVVSDANPRITKAIRKLQKSIIVPMPVLCSLEGRVAPGDIDKMLATFKKMAAEHPRNKIMEMLQIDDWQKFIE